MTTRYKTALYFTIDKHMVHITTYNEKAFSYNYCNAACFTDQLEEQDSNYGFSGFKKARQTIF